MFPEGFNNEQIQQIYNLINLLTLVGEKQQNLVILNKLMEAFLLLTDWNGSQAYFQMQRELVQTNIELLDSL